MGWACYCSTVPPIGTEELQIIWEAITALAAVAAMLIPEGTPKEKEGEAN